MSLELVLLNSDTHRFFDCSSTVSSHKARSFRPYLKVKNLHLTSRMTVFLVCFAEIPVVSPTAVVSSTEEPAGQCMLSAPPRPISTTALREEQKHFFFFIYFWTCVLRCGVNINEGLGRSFEILHIKWVYWDMQNFFHCLKSQCHWRTFPANLQKCSSVRNSAAVWGQGQQIDPQFVTCYLGDTLERRVLMQEKVFLVLSMGHLFHLKFPTRSAFSHPYFFIPICIIWLVKKINYIDL